MILYDAAQYLISVMVSLSYYETFPSKNTFHLDFSNDAYTVRNNFIFLPYVAMYVYKI